MTQYYQIEIDSKWCSRISKVENLEDVDEFFDEEELKEVLGLGEHDYIWSGATIKRKNVEEYLNSLKNELITNNKNSLIIKDESFVDFCKEQSISVSDYVKGLRRVGNRLSLFNKTVTFNTKPKKQDAQRIITIGLQLINSQIGPTVDIKYAHNGYGDVIRLLQKLFSWDEFETFYRDNTNLSIKMYSSSTGEEVAHNVIDDYVLLMKLVWDQPDMFKES